MTFAGRGWLIPVSDCDALLFIVVVVGAGVRVWRGPATRPALRGGGNRRGSRERSRSLAPSGAGS